MIWILSTNRREQYPNSDEKSRPQVFISLTSGPRQVRRFFDSEIDLTHNKFSGEEDDIQSVNVRSDQPPPDQSPAVFRQSADVEGPSGEDQNDSEMPTAPEIDPESAKIAWKRNFELKLKKITSIRMQFSHHIKQKHP